MPVQIMFKMQIMRLWMMMINKNFINFYLIVFSLGFLFSNEILLENIPTQGSDLNLYYNSSNSIIPEYVYPIYCNIELIDKNNEAIQNIHSSMVKAYWKGSNWWLFTLKIPYDAVNANVKFSASNSSFDKNSENFTFMIDTKKLSNEGVLTEIKELIINKNYEEAMLELNSIINSSDSDDVLKSECIYIISEVFLNDFNEYELASEYLEDIVNNYSTTEIAKKALFSLAYLYANNLHYYTDAINLYKQFKARYPADDLIPSIDYELNVLENIK